MHKKETIEDRIKALSEREKRLKLQFLNHAGGVKGKMKILSKTMLITGLVALVGYHIFGTLFKDDRKLKKK